MCVRVRVHTPAAPISHRAQYEPVYRLPTEEVGGYGRSICPLVPLRREFRFPAFESQISCDVSSYWPIDRYKVKSVPLQAWTGPEGPRKLRFQDYVTTAQDGVKVVSLTHRPPLPPRKYSWYSFLLEAESTPGP